MASIAAILKHPEDVPALVKMKFAAVHARKQVPSNPELAFCYTMLHKVSRSFAFVIQQLEVDLRNAVCVFYLVLRGLDTVEDDMSIPVNTKIPILTNFHHHIYDASWHFSCGVNEYKELMDQFHHVSNAFLALGKRYQEAIEEITRRMGTGMAKFIHQDVQSVEDYDEYCHYVAGLVGLGLSRLFHAACLEDLAPDFLSNSMGLFLQKTNIIRDYLEDVNEIPQSRMFWPHEIWSKYVANLEDLKEEERSKEAVQCLNEMITNALKHANDCLKYMSALHDPAIFRFCAIPQIMALATLEICYDNLQVFRGVVKIRRGLTAKIMDRTKNMADLYEAFIEFSGSLASKVPKDDPNAAVTLKFIDEIQRTCNASGLMAKRRNFTIDSKKGHEVCLATCVLLLAIVLAILTFKL